MTQGISTKLRQQLTVATHEPHKILTLCGETPGSNHALESLLDIISYPYCLFLSVDTTKKKITSLI